MSNAPSTNAVYRPIDPAEHIAKLARCVLRDWREIGVISTGEQIAVALVLNRLDWLPSIYKHPLEAIERLGDDWLQGAIRARQELLAAGEIERLP